MTLRFDSICAPSFRKEGVGWLQPSRSSSQAAEVLGAARSFRAAHTPAGLPGRADRFDAAVELYESGCWREAFSASASLADEGDAGAAKLTLLMLRHGVPLYGISFPAEPRQIARWAKQVLGAGMPLPPALPPAPRPATQSGSAPTAIQREPRALSRRTASPRSITAIA